MRILLTSLAALTLALAFGGVAAAQDRAVHTDQESTFDDDEVTGDTVGPDVLRIVGLERRRRESLIRPRAHFVPELVHSIEGF